MMSINTEKVDVIEVLNNEKNQTKRLEYIDIFRAIGIIFMIMGHIGFGGKFDYFIHAFHMPMFFIISGYFFKEGINIKKFIRKKARGLLVPYLSFGIISYIIWLMFNFENKSIAPLIHLFSINTEGLPIPGALWFLTALFFTELIYFFISKIKSSTYKNIIVFSIALLGNIAVLILPFRLPFALDAAFVGVGLFHIGNMAQKYINNTKFNKILNLKTVYIFLLMIVSIILIFVNRYVNMRVGEYGIIPLFWINVILATIVGVNISKKLENILNLKVKSYIISIGQNSIVYLCLNQIIIKILESITILNDLNSVEKLIVAIIQFIIVMLILWVLDLIIQKTNLKVLIGKKEGK